MKKTYFKPEFKIVKLHGHARLLDASSRAIQSSRTNLEGDDFEYVGGGDYEGR